MTPIPGSIPKLQGGWEQHWTIFPRVINGRWYCREYVYRRWVSSPGGGFWQYGDEFDILKEN
jgi:hypothetical protein